MACRWTEISAEERATYEELAKEDKTRYEREQTAFEAEHGVPEAVPKPPKKRKAEAPAVCGSRP